MIRIAGPKDYEEMFRVINDSAGAYKGVIPADCWTSPYMPMEELIEEIRDGVNFWVSEYAGMIQGVMGIQDRGDVTLIRHAYVLPRWQRQGIGSRLLNHFQPLLTTARLLIGTWADASWAIRFYQKHGFTLLPDKDKLLRQYWDVPQRQIETSVVLGIEYK